MASKAIVRKDVWVRVPPAALEHEEALRSKEEIAHVLSLWNEGWRQSRHNTISIARREGIEILDGFVGPKS